MDSLLSIWNQSKDDTTRVSACVRYSSMLMNIDASAAIKYADSAFTLAERSHFEKGLGNLYNVKANALRSLGRYEESFTNHMTALEIRKKINDSMGIAGSLNNIGLIYDHLGNYSDAIKYYHEALSLNKKIINKKWMSTNYINIGVTFSRQKQYDSAIFYNEKGYQIAREINDKRNIAFCAANLGTCLHEKKQYKEGMAYLTEALKLRREEGDIGMVAQTLNNLALTQVELGMFKQAEENALEGLKLAEQSQFFDSKLNALKALGSVYEQTKDYEKSLRYFRRYWQLNDSLHEQENLVKISDIQARYDEEKAEHKINELKTRYQKDEERLSKVIFYSIIGFLALVLLATLFYFRMRVRNKANDQLKNYLNDLKTVEEIGRKITATVSVEEINNTVYTEINKLMDASGFGIGIISEDRRTMSFPGYIENGKNLGNPLYDLSDENRLAVHCAIKNAEIFITDLERDFNKYIKITLPPLSGARCESIIYLPLIAKRGTIGVITVQSFKKNAFSEYHLNILRNICNHTTIALENARLYAGMEKEIEARTREVIVQKEELEQNSENTRLLSEIGLRITSTLNFDTIFFQLYENVNRLMPAEVFGVRIYYPEKNAIEYKFEIENGKRDDEHAWVSMDDVDNYSVWCVSNRKEIFINDNLNEYSRYVKQIRVVAGEMPHSLIFYPLIAGDKVIGVISIQSFQKNAYKPIHLSILKTLASYTAIALQNADFYNTMEEKVKERTLELSTAKAIIEEKNKDITDSIRYAKKIQTALLPGQDRIDAAFPKNFIYFRPRDIVSGDFYFFTHTDNVSVFAVADCTGHGVPGAIISAICIELMYQVLEGKTDVHPGNALTLIDKNLRALLKQDLSGQSNDGMDCGLCVYNHNTKELTFAGAHRPLLHLRAGELTEYKHTSCSIGGDDSGGKHFDTHRISIEGGDRIFVFTDGMVDQFGGPKGKKFKYKRVQELILETRILPIELQQEYIDRELNNWKQDYEQVDDILMMGIEF